MGMFDRIYNSYEFTNPILNNTLQTKDISGFMDDYWLSPSGQLFWIDYTATYDFGIDWKPVRNSNNGHVRPHLLTKTIKVLPEIDGYYDCEGRLEFKDGRLVDAALWKSGSFAWGINWKNQGAILLPSQKNSEWNF